MTTPAAAPLAHVKVLDLSRMYPGAFCSLLLADLGADVVKVEAPGFGDGMRAMAAPGSFNAAHTALNRGKRSLALDLRSPGVGAVLNKLVHWADVVIESHKPGQLDAMGIGYTAMSAVNPRLVWCSISGYGDTGPMADAAGHDITYLGYSGLLGALADGAPTPPMAGISLPAAATMAVVGILAALSSAALTGQGARLDASMADAAMWMLSEDVARAANDPQPGWGSFAARNVYECADGRNVTVAANEPRTWAALCEGLGVPELAGHRIGIDADAPVTARLREVFATQPAAHWCAAPGLKGGIGPVNSAADLLDDPQVAARGSVVALAGTDMRVLANPIRFDSAVGAAASHALRQPPGLGEHTADVLAMAGFDRDEVAALREANVVG